MDNIELDFLRFKMDSVCHVEETDGNGKLTSTKIAHHANAFSVTMALKYYQLQSIGWTEGRSVVMKVGH